MSESAETPFAAHPQEARRFEKPDERGWRGRMHAVIFEADTPTGKFFDVALLAIILLSVLAVVVESTLEPGTRAFVALRAAEWVFTIIFTVEYVLRLLSVRKPLRYATSFFGIIDLAAVIPTYLSLFVTGTQALIVIRTLRMLRVFRIFKAARYVSEISAMARAFRTTRRKIAVFLFVLFTAVIILGTAMHVVEGPRNEGFASIPRAIYWAIVTVTTVGYGDIAPSTLLGRAFAAVAMLFGYALIIIPTGVFSVALVQASRQEVSTQHCPSCSREGHDVDAEFCKWCGAAL